MSEQLTNDDIRGAIGAIHIAQGEAGDDAYKELEEKLFRLYPEVKEQLDKADREWDESVEKQRKEREANALRVFNSLDPKKPIIPQVKDWIKANTDDYLVEEVFISSDLFKYHLPELRKLGLIEEIRKELSASDSSYHRSQANNPEEDLWHGLMRS